MSDVLFSYVVVDDAVATVAALCLVAAVAAAVVAAAVAAVVAAAAVAAAVAAAAAAAVAAAVAAVAVVTFSDTDIRFVFFFPRVILILTKPTTRMSHHCTLLPRRRSECRKGQRIKGRRTTIKKKK